MTQAQAAEGGSATGNPARGETSIHVGGRELVLRPTFDALCRAEEELGSLFALVERAAAGELRLSEIAALFWHCLARPGVVERADVGEAVVEMGVARASVPLKLLLGQVLRGR
ncbi:gene transfer agent family protein [Qipengyuania gelatinilytica]|uniref:Gene transfer agent family protein n=1 Tax=Qipengyuania gelatinilytica TaxID=2867231 RepID=A0ABX8ZZV8_9SPHN|nr:gene transfer agent family protein [Qipengyuania gelatinilytica]QZD94321.1 gene transfer agent family protein [Qipengyuania gelatinilytica]